MTPKLVILALEYYRSPLSHPTLKDTGQPLPAGIEELLAAFKGALSAEQIDQTAADLGATPDELTQAVMFFIKQVLLAKNSDYYRILGLDSSASRDQVKRHYRLLIGIFHPDRDTEEIKWDNLYVPRINEAYNTLKTPEKRSAYDASLDRVSDHTVNTSPEQGRHRRARKNSGKKAASTRKTPLNSRMLVIGLVVVAVITVLIFVNQSRQSPGLVSTQTTAPTQPEYLQNSEAGADVSKDAEHTVVDGAHLDASETEEKQNGHADNSVGQERSNEPDTATVKQVEPQTPRRTSEATIRAQVEARVAQATSDILGYPDSDSSSSTRTVDAASSSSGTVPPAGASASPRSVPESAPAAASPSAEQTASDTTPQQTATNLPVGAATSPRSVPESAPAAASPLAEQTTTDTTSQQTAANLPVGAAASPRIVDEANHHSPDKTASIKQASQSLSSRPDLSTNQENDTALFKLIANLIAAYNSGNIDQFTSLFDDNAVVTEGQGIAFIRDLYTDFFASQESRELVITDFNWSEPNGDLVAGNGQFYVQLRARQSGNLWQGQGAMQIQVDLGGGPPKIVGMFHQVSGESR